MCVRSESLLSCNSQRIYPQHLAVRDNTCCPTFLLASGGPWLTVLGAIFTDKVVVQRLTDFIWVGTDTT